MSLKGNVDFTLQQQIVAESCNSPQTYDPIKTKRANKLVIGSLFYL
jgi:hypothetical protein